ncbi:hypothetical protein INT47_009136 [Mucor saturninus]|uniref:Uncharacterized protein n=1 Tax=Mucor saturninus TaxID=64648 RepID=A0A8H7RNL9_9FUNG|nr:hypothetical protein INT47_009136 [Mucor saturninus]
MIQCSAVLVLDDGQIRVSGLCTPYANQRDLCRILRAPAINPDDFHPAKHYDPRAVENIAGAWIDVMCSPLNTIVTERNERTSAINDVILVINNLLRPYNDIVHTRWIEFEDGVTKRHNWDGVVTILDDKAAVMMIEFAGGFVDDDQYKLENSTTRIYRNASRLINSRNSSSENPPSIFVVINYHFKIYSIG